MGSEIIWSMEVSMGVLMFLPGEYDVVKITYYGMLKQRAKEVLLGEFSEIGCTKLFNQNSRLFYKTSPIEYMAGIQSLV